MQHITEPYKGAFQVRVVRNKKERSKLFSWSHWGGKKSALKAANSWRDQVLTVYDIIPNRFQDAFKNNKSTGVLGVTKKYSTDYRKITSPTYLVYAVNWKDHTGKKRNKTFQAGNIEDYQYQIDELAFETAKAFRKEYEKHWDNNTLEKFDISKYKNWRE